MEESRGDAVRGCAYFGPIDALLVKHVFQPLVRVVPVKDIVQLGYSSPYSKHHEEVFSCYFKQMYSRLRLAVILDFILRHPSPW